MSFLRKPRNDTSSDDLTAGQFLQSQGRDSDENGKLPKSGRDDKNRHFNETKGSNSNSGNLSIENSSSQHSKEKNAESTDYFSRHPSKDNLFPLSDKFKAFDEHGFKNFFEGGQKKSHSLTSETNFSPRSSIVSLHSAQNSQGKSVDKLKENYKGFHSSRKSNGVNVPPLSQPVKPAFRKRKGGSLLGKLIYSKRDSDATLASGNKMEQGAPLAPGRNRIDSRNSASTDGSNNSNNTKSVSSSESKASHKMGTNEYKDTHHSPGSAGSTSGINLQNKFRNNSTDTNIFGIKRTPTTFDLDMDLNEMSGIVKASPENQDELGTDKPSQNSKSSRPSAEHEPRKQDITAPSNASSSNAIVPVDVDLASKSGIWRAPDSWDVKLEAMSAKPDHAYASESDSDGKDTDSDLYIHGPTSDEEHDRKFSNSNTKHTNKTTSPNASTKLDMNGNVIHSLDFKDRKKLPVLYGKLSSVSTGHYDSNSPKGPNYIIRVFKEDNTFTTILCPLETTTAELLQLVQKKFFLETVNNFQISVYIGNSVKVLESFEKPLKIQTELLKLSGYADNDNLRIIGREDLSFLCKFVIENIYLRSLTHEEETSVSKDYTYTNISGLNLKNIPIIFHQHTYEIEKLNVADNPSIYIPLDFIQSCARLTSITFSRNGCSKFPINLLQATNLSYLDLQKNFLDEIPSRISHLKNLTHLYLNSNYLTTLPKSFSKLVNLEVLNLSSNYFSEYPEVVNKLTKLKDLDLSYNDLSELPSSMRNLRDLKSLNLCTNKLAKALPDFISELMSLTKLDIRYNKITNIDVLGSLPNLEVLKASKNGISNFSDKMKKLRSLYFDRNPIVRLEFELVLPALNILDLSKAKISNIPGDFIKKITNLEKIVLDKNHLVRLPDELGSLTKLVYLSAYGNNIEELPLSIKNLTNLQYLDLHANSLQQVPESIWYLESLSHLNLSSNMLTSFAKPPLSMIKAISRTSGSASITNSSANLASTFNIRSESTNSDETIENEIGFERKPEAEETSDAVDKLNKSRGFLSGSLLILYLADNRLNDEFFETLSFFRRIEYLNLSYNDIIEIPEGVINRMNNLMELHLSGNQLTSLPAEDLEDLKALKALYLNNNKLVSLPAELSSLSNLQTLDVGSNQLKYNISNWPYDWNWQWNKKLKYLNFSGNKRFEIKQSHVKNPETGEDFDSFLVLKNLKVLGLIDLTLTTPSVPDHNLHMRVRTTASELANIGYGVSDSMGSREYVSLRDIFIQKFRGSESEVLLCAFDGKNGSPNKSHVVSEIARNELIATFTKQLNSMTSKDTVEDAIRRSFLSMNKVINSAFSAKKYSPFSQGTNLSLEMEALDLKTDADSGCAVTMIYIKDKLMYSANIGDVEALLSKNNGEYLNLTTKHDPPNRTEFERIRASGGYVSGDGALDGDLQISRGAGYFNYLPHTHSGPDITVVELTAVDDLIVIASKTLWDYISYELAIDVLRQEKEDPVLAAQKLRDFAISYGATDKIVVIVLTLGDKKKGRLGSTLYHNLGRETDIASKKRRDRGQQFAGDTSLRTLEDEIQPPEGTLALVFTDIKNSTLLWDVYPTAMRSAIKIHNKIMRRQLRIVGGYEVKTEGDAFMVSFPSPTAAILWSFTVQKQLLVQDWPTEILDTSQGCEVTDNKGETIFRGLSVRMGLHWGMPVCERDLVTRRMDYFGPMVNRTARISAIADGGQIAVSSDFLKEMEVLLKLHEDISNNKISLSDAYQGNILVGEIIEREVRAIREAGVALYPLGEMKLKGLEAPEMVTLLYPKSLDSRYEFFQRNFNSENSNDQIEHVLGSFPVDVIYGLRTLSLKLEDICAYMNGGFIGDTFQRNSSQMISTVMKKTFKETDLLELLNHIVTRIENCAAVLELRQQVSFANGNEGHIDFVSTLSFNNLFDELSKMLNIVNEVKQIKSAHAST